MDELYREIILEHWKNPQNYGIIESADIDVVENNPLCGDTLRLTILLQRNKVKDVNFSSEGCAISTASASLFTEKIKGMNLENIKAITAEEVLEELGVTLTPSRIKCALLIYSTLQKSLKNKS